MTKRKCLPYIAQENVKRASELLNEADRVLEPLSEQRVIIREEVNVRTLRARLSISHAQRLLESIGAQTTP